MNLQTEYLGMPLDHPLIVGASPLLYDVDMARRLEDAGAAAMVMPSLFEEQISHMEAGAEAHVFGHDDFYAEATSYYPGQAVDFSLGPESYIDQIEALKAAVSVPLIASLNGITDGAWLDYSKMMAEAGADALELNLYFLPNSDKESSSALETRAADIVRLVTGHVPIPVAVKLSPFFTSLSAFVRRLEEAGARAVVLFNRFYQPDIDIEELANVTRLELSDSRELLLRLRWVAVLYERTPLNLAITGGVHTAQDVIKGIMAGADGIQLVSALLKNGPGHLGRLREELEFWMEEHEYESLKQMKGCMSLQRAPDPEVFGRANYMKILQSWKP